MADLRLIHPEDGRTVAVESTEHTRFVLDFPSADAVTGRDGSDLVFTFPDGASFVVTGFYTTYHLENVPEFVLDGLAVAGEEFFTALNDEDLMPAADAEALLEDARFRNWGDSGLADGLGVEKMTGLDLEPEVGPTPIRSGSIVLDSGKPGSLAGVGGLGGGGSGYTRPDPLPDPKPDPGPDPKPDPDPDPKPDPKPDPDPDPVPDPVSLTITPTHGKEGVLFNGGKVSFTFQSDDPPGEDGVVVVKVLVTNSITGDAIPYDVPLNADGSGLLSVLHGNEEDVYRDPSTMTLTVVSDGYTVVGGDEQGQVVAHVEDTINWVTASVSTAVMQDADGNDVRGVTVTLPLVALNEVKVDVWLAERGNVSADILSHQYVQVIIPAGAQSGTVYAYDLSLSPVASKGVFYDERGIDGFYFDARVVDNPAGPQTGDFEGLWVPISYYEPVVLGTAWGSAGGAPPSTLAVSRVQINPPYPPFPDGAVAQLIFKTSDGVEHLRPIGPDGTATFEVCDSIYRTTVNNNNDKVSITYGQVLLPDGSREYVGSQYSYTTSNWVSAPLLTTEAAIDLVEVNGQLLATVSLTAYDLDKNKLDLMDTSPGLGHETTVTCIITINGVEQPPCDIIISGTNSSATLSFEELGLDVAFGDTVSAKVQSFEHDAYTFGKLGFAGPDTIIFGSDIQALAADFTDEAGFLGILASSDDEGGGASFGASSGAMLEGDGDASFGAGHGDIDFLIGPDDHFLDTLLHFHVLEPGTTHVDVPVEHVAPGCDLHTEVYVQVNESAHPLSLTNADDLAANLGITIHDGQIHLDAQHWQDTGHTEIIHDAAYVEWHYTHDGIDATILVQKSILENTHS